MLRGSRPTATLAAALIVLSGALSACGGSSTPGTGLSFGDRLDAVTVDGDIGAATFDWKERMSAGSLEAETLVTGDGEALKKDDEVYLNYAFGNGYTRSTTIDTFGEEAPAIQYTVGADENAEPASLDDVLKNLLRDYVKEGVTKGTRIAVTGDTPAFFPSAETTQLGALLATEGIGNDDGLVMVVDVMPEDLLEAPEGESTKPPVWFPKIKYKGTDLVGLDFAGIPKTDAKDKLLWKEVRTGTGPVVEKGDLLVADYIGQVNGQDEVFDSSFTAEREPTAFPIGLANVIEGWDQVLVGRTVGSRIVMRVPPAKAYADQKKPGIPKNSTLYFVVDILGSY